MDFRAIHQIKNSSQDILENIKVIKIKNNSSNDLLLKIGLFDICNYSNAAIGIIKLPVRKSFIYHNQFTTKILQISLGRPNETNIDVICHGILVFDTFEIDDNYFSFEQISFAKFGYSHCGQDNDCINKPLQVDPITYYIINKSLMRMILYINIHDAICDNTYCVGWVYLPSYASYKYVNFFATKLFTVTAGFPNKDCRNIFCINIPIFREVTIFDDNYLSFDYIFKN